MDQADFPWRPLGLLLVDKGLVTPKELEFALDEQELAALRSALDKVAVDCTFG